MEYNQNNRLKFVNIGLIFFIIMLAMIINLKHIAPAYANEEFAFPKIEWQISFGEKDLREDPTCVRQTNDGGFVIAGTKRAAYYSASNKEGVYIAKTDSLGNKKWEKTFIGDYSDGGYSVVQANDGGYLIVGYKDTSELYLCYLYLIKVDSSGKKQWEKTFKGKGMARGRWIERTRDGGYIIFGDTHSMNDIGNDDIYIIKLDSKGNKLWEKIFGSETQEWVNNGKETSDGNYIISGCKKTNNGHSNIILIKIDHYGNKLWEKIFEEGSNGVCVEETKDKGYIISFSLGDWIPGLLKTDSDGNKQWEQIYQQFPTERYRFIGSVVQTPNGGYIILGDKIIRTDSQGKILWYNLDLSGESIVATKDGGYVITGFKHINGSLDTNLLKINIEKNVDVKINGKAINWLVQPYLENGKVVVPVKELAEHLNLKYSWEIGSHYIFIDSEKVNIKLEVLSDIAYINESKKNLGVKTKRTNYQYMAPLRSICEAFGYKVSWNDENHAVSVDLE